MNGLFTYLWILTLFHMGPSFIAIANKAGLACAADADSTIYKLSKGEPLAIAVNPKSPIPWERIITKYKLKGDPASQVMFSEYATCFEGFLSTIPFNKNLGRLSDEQSRVILFGFGADDIYPSLFVAQVGISDNGKLCFVTSYCTQIGVSTPVNYETIGDFESMLPILTGANTKMRQYFINKFVEIGKVYKQRIKENVRGSKHEDAVTQHLAAYDERQFIENTLDDADSECEQNLFMGIETFSVQDLIDAAETIVNANAQLNYLKSGCKDAQAAVKEIAIMTRPEGMTWIKHSLFAL